jgi:hypothetical protein
MWQTADGGGRLRGRVPLGVLVEWAVRLGGVARCLVNADGAWRNHDHEGFSDGEDFYPSEGEQVFGITIWSALTLRQSSRKQALAGGGAGGIWLLAEPDSELDA